MAAASYSSDVLQRYYGRIDEAIQSLPEPLVPRGRIDEAIQNLPPEIREKIYKELIAIKMKERKEMGWNEVHDHIKNAPFCEKRLSITNLILCVKCPLYNCDGLCGVCFKKGETHFLNCPIINEEGEGNYDEIFMKFPQCFACQLECGNCLL